MAVMKYLWDIIDTHFAKKILKLKEKTPNILRKFVGQGIRLVPSRLYDSLSRPFQKLLGIHGFSHKMSKLSNILEYENNSDFYEKLNIFDNEVLDKNLSIIEIFLINIRILI